MKLKSKLLALCFAVLLTLGCAIGFAACDDAEELADTAETKSYIVTVTCDETKGSYTLTPSANADGKYEEGTSVTLTVTPKAEYEVDSVKVNDSAVTLTENKYTFNVGKDTTVVVAFKDKTEVPPVEEKVNLTLTYTEAEGTVTSDPAPVDGKVAKGVSVTVTVTPAENYEIDSVKVNGSPVELTGDHYAFTADTDTTVEVTFKVKTVNLTLTYTEAEGTVTSDPAPVDGKVAKGASVTVTVTPAENYEVDSVKVNGSAVELTGDHYTFTADTDTTVEVTFKVKVVSYDVTVSLTEGGRYRMTQEGAASAALPSITATREGKTYIVIPEKDTDVTVTIYLYTDAGYKLKSITIGETDKTQELTQQKDGKYVYTTFTLTESCEIALAWEKVEEPCKVTIDFDGRNGSVSIYDFTTSIDKPLEDLEHVLYGTRAHLRITPDRSEYEVTLSVNGEPVELTSSSYFCYIYEDTTFKVIIKSNEPEKPEVPEVGSSVEFSVGLTPALNAGTYTLSSYGSYKAGDTVILTVMPYSKYVVESVTVNGEPVSPKEDGGSEYELTLTAWVTRVEIVFAEKEPVKPAELSVTVTPELNAGTYELSALGSYKEGDVVTLTLKPYSGYSVESVTFNEQPISPKEEGGLVYELKLAAGANLASVVFAETVKSATLAVNMSPSEEGGSYDLSSDGPYKEGDTVTLTVHPESGYAVKSVTLNAVSVSPKSDLVYDLTLAAGENTVEITFEEVEMIFPEAVLGVWDPSLASGTVGASITVNAGSVVFEGKTCPVTNTDGVLSFTYQDDEGASTVYTPAYRSIRDGLYLFTLTYTDLSDSSEATAYFLKHGEDYETYTFPQEFVGDWEIPDGSGNSLTVTEESLLWGTRKAIVLEYDASEKILTMLAGSELFTVKLQGTKQLAVTHQASGKESTSYYSKVLGTDPVLLPQYAGTYTSKDGVNILVVNEDGSAKYSVNSGASYYEDVLFCPADKFGLQKNSYTMKYNSLSQEWSADFLTDAGLGVRVWIRKSDTSAGIELYASDYKEPNMKIKVEIVGGVGGSYTISPDPVNGEAGYRAGVTVSITITADADYVFETVQTTGMLAGHWSNLSFPSELKTVPGLSHTFTFEVTDKKIENYKDFDGYTYRVTFAQVTSSTSTGVSSEVGSQLTDMGIVEEPNAEEIIVDRKNAILV